MAGKVTIDETMCKGCALCVAVCPCKLLELDRSTRNAKGYHPVRTMKGSACTGCAMCGIICPDSAIAVERV